MWLFLKKCVKLNVSDKIRFWWETVELPPAKEKITNQTHKKPHKDKVSAEEKSPTFGFPTAKPSSCHYKKTQAPPGGGKLFFPRKQVLPQAVLPCPIFFTWIKWKLELGERCWPDKKMDFRNKMSWDEQSQHSSTLLPWQVPMSSFTITRLVVPVGIPEGWEQILLLSMICSSTSPCAFPGKPCCLISLCLTV